MFTAATPEKDVADIGRPKAGSEGIVQQGRNGLSPFFTGMFHGSLQAGKGYDAWQAVELVRTFVCHSDSR